MKPETEKNRARSKKNIALLSIMLIVVLSLAAGKLDDFYGKIADKDLGGDFFEYWAAGRLLLLGNNPYSPDQLLNMQLSAGFAKEKPIIMYNPPWALTFILPFCWQNYFHGKFLWLFFNFALVLFCSDLAWRLYGGSYQHRAWALILAFTFIPTLFMINMGQIVPMILLGVVGFLYLAKQRRYGLIGIPAVLIAIKPHTLYLFWIALLVWTLDRRYWWVIGSCAASFLAAMIIPLTFSVNILNQNIGCLRNHSPFYWATPSGGTALRLIFGVEKLWLPFLPALLGVAWFLIYYSRNRKTWEWNQHVPLVLLVSVMTAPFAWTWDYPVLLPVIMQVAVALFHGKKRRIATAGILFYFAINGVALILHVLLPADHLFFWMVPALLASYLILMHAPATATTTSSKTSRTNTEWKTFL